MRGTPHAIALGFALGVLVSFTPFVGLHIVMAAFLAWATGGSLLSSLFGTFLGNPLTFPLIWATCYELGQLLIGGVMPMPERALSTSFLTAPGDALAALGPVLWPMMVGGLPLGVIAAGAFYFPIRYAVEAYQNRRRNLLRRPVGRPPHSTEISSR